MRRVAGSLSQTAPYQEAAFSEGADHIRGVASKTPQANVGAELDAGIRRFFAMPKVLPNATQPQRSNSWLATQVGGSSPLNPSAPQLRTPADRQQMAERINFRLPDMDVLDSGTLIQALQRMDVSPLHAAGIRPVAAFDFDNTLLHGDVFEIYMRFLVERGALEQEALPGILNELATRASNTQVDAIRDLPVNEAMASIIALFDAGQLTMSDLYFISVKAMKGMHKHDAERLAHELYKCGGAGFSPYKKRVYPASDQGGGAQEIVRVLEAKGVECIIVTAGLEMLARAGASYVGIPPEKTFGAQLAAKDGILTGEADNVPEIGKHNIVHEKMGNDPLFAFGDSYFSDKPMLNTSMARGFMVGVTSLGIPAEFVRRTAKAEQDHIGLLLEPPNGFDTDRQNRLG